MLRARLISLMLLHRVVKESTELPEVSSHNKTNPLAIKAKKPTEMPWKCSFIDIKLLRSDSNVRSEK